MATLSCANHLPDAMCWAGMCGTGKCTGLHARHRARQDWSGLEHIKSSKVVLWRDTLEYLQIPWYQCRLGDGCLKSSPEEMDLVLLVDERLDMNLQCALAA